ncbi:MAG: hypothetical protein IPM97_03190 [Bdellovibrionaceae bacterium]|nr:hypothetical protein [Pseudobdellovibrionaceae bacterium]
MGVAGAGITSLNGLSAEQSFYFGTAGTDIGISSAGSAHTFDIPTASATSEELFLLLTGQRLIAKCRAL